MKRVMFSIFSSFFVILFIWVIQAYIEYDDDFVNYTIDLERTMEYFEVDFKVQEAQENFKKTAYDIQDWMLKNLGYSTPKASHDFTNIVSLLGSFFYNVIPFVFSILYDSITLLTCIFDFIFYPKFIRFR